MQNTVVSVRCICPQGVANLNPNFIRCFRIKDNFFVDNTQTVIVVKMDKIMKRIMFILVTFDRCYTLMVFELF